MPHLPETAPAPLWPLAVYGAAVLAVVVGMLVISWLLGQRHRQRATGEPYESGIVSTGTARLRLSVQFYLVAMFFVIFDLEAVFLVAWALVAREAGWTGYIEILVFIAVLLAALVYLWREGALDWGPRRRPRERGATAGREPFGYSRVEARAHPEGTRLPEAPVSGRTTEKEGG